MSMDGFIGEIRMFGGNFAPRFWAFCDGQLISVAENSALFSILGTTYGGDGRTTFALPDLRGRVPVGPGQGPGLSHYQIGSRGGSESASLTVDQLPPHTHQLPDDNITPATPVEDRPAPARWQVNRLNLTRPRGVSEETERTGGGQPHENRPPYQSIPFIICMQGIYPSRS
jgi:microcystin-dependent protein